MPIEFPEPKWLRSAGYAPVQDDVPLSPPMPIPVTNSEPTANYECRIKVHAPKSDISSLKLGIFTIGKSENEPAVKRWQSEEGVEPTLHTIMSSECLTDDPKALLHEYHKDFGLSSAFDITPKPIGSDYINAEFAPLLPSVESEGRLGWATHGFYYYFYDGKLYYELDILGDGKWGWKVTRSTQEGILEDPISGQIYSALLIPVKIEGQEPKPQHIMYSRRKMTNDQLAEVNAEWLGTNATLLDTVAMVESLNQKPMERQLLAEGSSESVESKKHTVRPKDGGQHETWSDIASMYGLSPKGLLGLNPEFESDPMSLKSGDKLIVQATTSSISEKQNSESPSPLSELEEGGFYILGNVWGQYSDPRLSPSVKNIFAQKGVSQTTPVLNVRKVEEKILRIGVFFDGTGQNYLNDKYKETMGVKSRTNVARLFEAYPLADGIEHKIYVSGVGTVDDAWKNPQLIDEGKDESGLAQAFGVDVMNVPLADSALNSIYNDSLSETTETGAFYKWQNWTNQYYDIISGLIRDGLYDAITHVQFDVFGFSRGAALARHFVNAVKDGIPDYSKPRVKKKCGDIYPNLLGDQTVACFDKMNGYFPEEDKTCGVRFTGLFDTVGSFYLAGNQDDGNFVLGLDMDSSEVVYQACAYHEYRKNFPLTSLFASDGLLASNFHQEVFPGCHTDIGGGYPSKEQYKNTSLPERYGIPPAATYNRELIKTESIVERVRGAQSSYEASAISDLAFKEADSRWQMECKSHGVHGLVTLVNGVIYYYELQAISNGLSALPLERMKQQAAKVGVAWQDDEYILPIDYSKQTGVDVELGSLCGKFLDLPVGSIQPAVWQREIEQNGKFWVHRPHDALINAGCETMYDRVVNDVTREGNQLKRVVFDNEV
ncbi:phospholipase effector Tle1 domain-containing protein [Vibrio sp. D431a]|uniref:phospholipase effector Tle1 domain-containing protein n=1 Tax=Vibrio sp. D431a TaxID=2837388 RepID=UPI002555C569|nr:DUF2235 domain-containing protein [Vibrio sp. D431a]MDK9790030.1 LysM domain-containing protein [Vibrio sp. D431a]